MNHLDFRPTPLERLNYFSDKWNLNILCKRDDLFTKAGGGNKSRMLQYILYPLHENKVTVLLTAGGPCSNYNRATALMCSELGIQMKLVSYTDNASEYESSLNYYITRLAGVEHIYCDKSVVPETIQKIETKLQKDIISYRCLYGGGKSLEGVYAYYDAVRELRQQHDERLDKVFIACGTGTTLVGVCCGMQEFFPETEVHAISVARDYKSEYPVLKEDLAYLNEYLNSSFDLSNLVFHDEYLLGGYGHSSHLELEVIRECASKQGMLIDPTYSGKAFYGMSQLLLKESVHGATILFWNTGGLMNLLSQRTNFNL